MNVPSLLQRALSSPVGLGLCALVIVVFVVAALVIEVRDHARRNIGHPMYEELIAAGASRRTANNIADASRRQPHATQTDVPREDRP